MNILNRDFFKVGIYQYKFRQTRGLCASSENAGELNPWNEVIEVDADLPEMMKTQTIFHELLHAANQTYHLGLDDEAQLDRLASVLLQLLVENGLLR